MPLPAVITFAWNINTTTTVTVKSTQPPTLSGQEFRASGTHETDSWIIPYPQRDGAFGVSIVLLLIPDERSILVQLHKYFLPRLTDQTLCSGRDKHQLHHQYCWRQEHITNVRNRLLSVKVRGRFVQHYKTQGKKRMRETCRVSSASAMFTISLAQCNKCYEKKIFTRFFI